MSIEDVKSLLVLGGASVVLLGCYLITPGLGVAAIGVYLVWLGQR